MTEARELPHNFEAEASVAGCHPVGQCRVTSASPNSCSRITSATPLHGKLFAAVAKLIDRRAGP